MRPTSSGSACSVSPAAIAGGEVAVALLQILDNTTLGLLHVSTDWRSTPSDLLWTAPSVMALLGGALTLSLGLLLRIPRTGRTGRTVLGGCIVSLVAAITALPLLLPVAMQCTVGPVSRRPSSPFA